MIIYVFKWMLFLGLIACACAACRVRSNLVMITVFMSYSIIMSILWMILESPDLAITEAAVGAGVTGVLFFVTIKQLHEIGEASKHE